ncbi:hypothetical protein [Aeromicrobium sp. 179-A 4D2 NHS]|uniref:hypothetical protein n=1 Tax=Aeromicrobium sp. 179-A 4D2 NHS TaxID=3142375 RepID=UPI0039A1A9EA
MKTPEQVLEDAAKALQDVYDNRTANDMTFMNHLVVFGTDYVEALANDTGGGNAQDVEQEYIKRTLIDEQARQRGTE